MKRRVLGFGLIVLAALIVGGVWLVVQTQTAAPVIPLTPEESDDFEVITPENVDSLRRIHKIAYTQRYDPRTSTHSVVYSPDSKQIAVLGQEAVSEGFSTSVGLWDVKTGALIRRYEPQEHGTESLVFSPNGRWLIGEPVHTSMLGDVWNVQTGEALPIASYYEENRAYVGGPFMFLYSNELMIYNYMGETLDIWDLNSVTHRAIPIDVEVDSLRLAEDDRYIYINDALWSMETWQPVETTLVSDMTPEWHKKLCENRYHDRLYYSPDRHYFTKECYPDEFSHPSAQYWNAKTGKLIRHWAEDIGFPRYNPDGRLFASSGFWRIGFYDSVTAALLTDFINVETHVLAHVFSPDGRTFAIADPYNLYIFAVSDAPSGECPITDPSQTFVNAISTENMNRLMLLRQMGGPIGNDLTFSEDGRYLVERGDNFLRIWDITTQEAIFLSDDAALRTQQSLSFEYKQMVNGELAVVHAHITYDFTQRFVFHNDYNEKDTHYEIRQDGYYDHSVVNSESGEAWKPEARDNLLTLSPDGRLVVTSTDSYLYHFSLWQNNEYLTQQDDEPFYDLRSEWSYYDAAFSPDGRYIALLGYIPVTDSGYHAIHLWGICEP